jgi:PAS domain-containing protein
MKDEETHGSLELLADSLPPAGGQARPTDIELHRLHSQVAQYSAEVIVSKLRYRRLFESAKDGILILDAETGMIVDVIQAIRKATARNVIPNEATQDDSGR